MTTTLNTKIDASAITFVGVRGLYVCKPAFFHVENTDNVRDVLAVIEENHIKRGYHMCDPTRKVSEVAVMPSILLARQTGNAYPLDHTHESVQTIEAYQYTVNLAHLVYTALASSAEPVTVAKLVSAVEPNYGKPIKAGSAAERVVRDVMRDLTLFGLATATGKRHDLKTTLYTMVNPFEVTTMEERLVEATDEASIEAEAPVEASTEVAGEATEEVAQPKRRRGGRRS